MWQGLQTTIDYRKTILPVDVDFTLSDRLNKLYDYFDWDTSTSVTATAPVFTLLVAFVITECNRVICYTADAHVHSVHKARTRSYRLLEPLYYGDHLLAA